MIKEMQTLKRKCLRAFVRFKQSAFARKGTLALVALTLAAGDVMAGSKGAAGFTKATQEVSSYQTPVSNLMKAIAAVIVLVGASRKSWKRIRVIKTVFPCSRDSRSRWSSWASAAASSHWRRWP